MVLPIKCVAPSTRGAPSDWGQPVGRPATVLLLPEQLESGSTWPANHVQYLLNYGTVTAAKDTQ